jgi:hypothetical protein
MPNAAARRSATAGIAVLPRSRRSNVSRATDARVAISCWVSLAAVCQACSVGSCARDGGHVD